MFVVCGEALFDVFPLDDTAQGMTLDARVGGSPLNVAVGLARLGQNVGFLGGISTGVLGQRLMRALQTEGVQVDSVARLDAPSTLGLVGVDPCGVADYAFYGEGGADRSLQPKHLAAVPAAARVFHFGSYSMVAEPVGSTHRLLVERECERSLIAYDPNVRLNVEPRLERWRETVTWMSRRAQLLKVSDEDLDLLYRGEPPAVRARHWLDAGVSLVVVTRGGAGATAFFGDGQVDVAAPPVEVIDTVGAGDTFQAALLTWLAERALATPDGLRSLRTVDVEAALGFAMRAAAITCSRRGADLPRRADLD